MRISLSVNGQPTDLDVGPRTYLCDLLRDHLNLTGTKVGCDSAQCGSCVVLLDGLSVKSCAVLAVQADGSDVQTVEGLASNGNLSTLQASFAEAHGVQCGFCTPGLLMSITELLQQSSNPTEEEIRSWLDGNFCRCTGYQNVVRAVQQTMIKLGSPVQLVADTPGKRLYESQVRYLMENDVDGLVDNNYHPEATVVAGSRIIRGSAALKDYYRSYLQWVKIEAVVSTDQFSEAPDLLFFEATARSNFGQARVYDAFVLRDGKIWYHFTGTK